MSNTEKLITRLVNKCYPLTNYDDILSAAKQAIIDTFGMDANMAHDSLNIQFAIALAKYQCKVLGIKYE